MVDETPTSSGNPHFGIPSQGVLDALAEHFASMELLERAYSHFASGDKAPGDKIPWQKSSLKEGFQSLLQPGADTIGVDLPVFSRSGLKARPVVMLCAMDPLRNKDQKEPVSVGLTYSLDRVENNWHGSDRSNHSFFRIICQEYDLYVTDVFKLFFRLSDKMSNQLKGFRNANIHCRLLSEEIKAVKPVAVVALGSAAFSALRAINEESSLLAVEAIVDLPHLSWNASKRKIELLRPTTFIDGTLNQRLARYCLEELRNRVSEN